MSKDLSDKELAKEIQRLHQEKSKDTFNAKDYEKLMALHEENDRRMEKQK
jgi:hypothetical protein